MKPNITFFGESLPDRYSECLREDMPVADLLIVMGTSLTVAPVSTLPHKVSPWIPRLLINREMVGLQVRECGGPCTAWHDLDCMLV